MNERNSKLTEAELDKVAGGKTFTGYSSAKNPSYVAGIRAAKVAAMRQAGGGGKIVAQGQTEDGGYFVTIEQSVAAVSAVISDSVDEAIDSGNLSKHEEAPSDAGGEGSDE